MKEDIEILQKRYESFKSKGLNLDMSRGKPCSEQLELSLPMLDCLNSKSDLFTEQGIDCRNYGGLDGIPGIKELFAQILQVHSTLVMVGGNSSLNMMFDAISHFMASGVSGQKPWLKQGVVKFLCPSPGYDRHFAILSHFNIQPVVVPMLQSGPDMQLIEKLVQEDSKIKGIWCVPKYSNPQGIIYSQQTVEHFAKLKPLAKDFRIFWDNAYAVHDLYGHSDELPNIMEECIRHGNEDLPILFTSTSKITFAGSGVAAMAASANNITDLKNCYSIKTIGFNKINQLMHLRFLKDYSGILNHMKKHAAILRPKFEAVLAVLAKEFTPDDGVSWSKPRGGYFISVDVAPGCAKKTLKLCAEAGVKFTNAGATFPGGEDQQDSNIRIAPSYPSVRELTLATELFCICAKLSKA